MRSKIFIGLLSVIILFGLISCSGGNEEINESNSDEISVSIDTVDIKGTEQDIDVSTEKLSVQGPEQEIDVSTNNNSDILVGGDAIAPDETPGEISFTVLGSNFEYDIREMRVQQGDKVTVTFRSIDGFHDWVVDEFNAATQKVQTNGETTVSFIANKKGSFEYYCSVGSHRAKGMVGTLIVE